MDGSGRPYEIAYQDIIFAHSLPGIEVSCKG